MTSPTSRSPRKIPAPVSKDVDTLLEGAQAKMSAKKEAEAQKIYDDSIVCAEIEADDIKELLKTEGTLAKTWEEFKTMLDKVKPVYKDTKQLLLPSIE